MSEKAELVIKISGDNTELQKALQESNGDLTKFANSLQAQGSKAGVKFGEALGGSAKGGLRVVSESFQQISTQAASGFSGIAQSFLTLAVNPITLGVAAIGASVVAAFNFAKIGEENEKISKNFKTFASEAGLDAEGLKARIASIADGFVDLEEVLPRASEAVISLGKNANKLPEIFQLARNISVSTGKDINEVFDQLTKGIENQNERLLRNNLIRIDSKKAIEAFARANGVAVESLSDAAKQQAVLNAVLEQGTKKFGDNAKEAAPLQGGLQKLRIAFDDVKDSIGAVANSKFGEAIASGLSIVAQSIKQFADGIDRISGKPKTIEQEIAGINAQITRQIELSRLLPNEAEVYLKQADALKEKRLQLIETQNAEKSAADERARAAEKNAQLTKSEIVGVDSAAQIEEKRKTQEAIAALDAEAKALELESEAQHQANLQIIADEGNANTNAAREAQYEAQLAANEAQLQSEIDKASKIKDNEQKLSAQKLAITRAEVKEQQIEDQKKIQNARLTADAKLQIENNLFSAARLLVDQQSALGKSIAIAEAVRNTYRGATLALATYPPPFGAAAAASTVALGLAQVARITAANNGALVTDGQTGIDNQPFLLSKGEIVAPAKSFDEVIEGTARQRGFVKSSETAETNELLRQIAEKQSANNITITVNTDVIADENGINKLTEKIRDAIQFNGAPALG